MFLLLLLFYILSKNIWNICMCMYKNIWWHFGSFFSVILLLLLFTSGLIYFKLFLSFVSISLTIWKFHLEPYVVGLIYLWIFLEHIFKIWFQFYAYDRSTFLFGTKNALLRCALDLRWIHHWCISYASSWSMIVCSDNTLDIKFARVDTNELNQFYWWLLLNKCELNS